MVMSKWLRATALWSSRATPLSARNWEAPTSGPCKAGSAGSWASIPRKHSSKAIRAASTRCGTFRCRFMPSLLSSAPRSARTFSRRLLVPACADGTGLFTTSLRQMCAAPSSASPWPTQTTTPQNQTTTPPRAGLPPRQAKRRILKRPVTFLFPRASVDGCFGRISPTEAA